MLSNRSYFGCQCSVAGWAAVGCMCVVGQSVMGLRYRSRNNSFYRVDDDSDGGKNVCVYFRRRVFKFFGKSVFEGQQAQEPFRLNERCAMYNDGFKLER